MITVVIFDMDGLMFDTESAYTSVHEQMFSRRGMEFNAVIKSQLMGKRAYEVMSVLNSIWGKGENIDDLLLEQDELLVKLYNDDVEALPGLITLLQFLKENEIHAGIGTSSRRFLVDLLLKKHGLENAFEHIVSGDMVSRGKPHPDIFKASLALFGVSGSEALVLEDSRNGVMAAKNANCAVIAVPSIHTIHEDFALADLVVRSLEDSKIKGFLKST